MGSAALGLPYVATGWLNGYFHIALHPRDAASAVPLINEASGYCTAFEGNPFDVSSACCAATDSRIHKALLNVLRETS
jgi:fructose-1,6-bisphosphatase/inositol monophosphatase family enzyme